MPLLLEVECGFVHDSIIVNTNLPSKGVASALTTGGELVGDGALVAATCALPISDLGDLGCSNWHRCESCSCAQSTTSYQLYDTSRPPLDDITSVVPQSAFVLRGFLRFEQSTLKWPFLLQLQQNKKLLWRSVSAIAAPRQAILSALAPLRERSLN